MRKFDYRDRDKKFLRIMVRLDGEERELVERWARVEGSPHARVIRNIIKAAREREKAGG